MGAGLGSKIEEACIGFDRLLPIPRHATNTVYVEGVPFGTSEREVSRKCPSLILL